LKDTLTIKGTSFSNFEIPDQRFQAHFMTSFCEIICLTMDFNLI
jgi:hypothetical protein